MKIGIVTVWKKGEEKPRTFHTAFAKEGYDKLNVYDSEHSQLASFNLEIVEAWTIEEEESDSEPRPEAE